MADNVNHPAHYETGKFVQGVWFQLFKQDFSQYTKVLVEITAVAGVGGLLDCVLHIGVQPVFIPLSQCHGHRITPALCADFVGLLL